MDSLQYGSEISDVQEDLVRLNLRVRSLIETFQTVETYEAMEALNGDIRTQMNIMKSGLEKLRALAKKQRNVESSAMLKTDANNHEDQMAACQLAFKKANLACISRLNAKGRDSLFKRSSQGNSVISQINKRKLVDNTQFDEIIFLIF